jgi:hypothetical protein
MFILPVAGPQREPGHNIEMDPHEDLVVGGMFGWVSGPALKTVEDSTKRRTQKRAGRRLSPHSSAARRRGTAPMRTL